MNLIEIDQKPCVILSQHKNVRYEILYGDTKKICYHIAKRYIIAPPYEENIIYENDWYEAIDNITTQEIYDLCLLDKPKIIADLISNEKINQETIKYIIDNHGTDKRIISGLIYSDSVPKRYILRFLFGPSEKYSLMVSRRLSNSL